MAETKAQHNRRIRQENLREQLSAQGHVQHAVDIAMKFAEPLEREEVDRLKVKFDMHMKLTDKYLPALKAIEHTGEGGDQLAELFQMISGKSTGLPDDAKDK